MNTNRFKEIITRLTEEGERAQAPLPFSLMDSSDHLSIERKTAWAQLLSSAASAEESEEMVIHPILKAFEYSDLLHRYLLTHMNDESRHQKFLKDYVLTNFNFVKKRKTLTDIIIYKGIFRGVSLVSEKRPLPIIVAILFYEWFAEEFYSELTERAGADQLHNLKNLFIHIEKDEHRHRAGIKALLAIWKSEGKKIDQVDLILTKFLLGVTRMDVNTASWAFYNNKLKRNLSNLGMDTEKIYRHSKAYADKAIAELEIAVEASS